MIIIIMIKKKTIDIAIPPIKTQRVVDQFDCDEVGDLTEFVSCKLDKDTKKLRITQPVLMQSFADEFNLLEGLTPVTPAEPGLVLMKAKDHKVINGAMQSMYQSGVGKLIHMMKWLRPDMLNAVQDLRRQMSLVMLCHVKVMEQVMTYLTMMLDQGLMLEPNAKWDGSKEFEFKVMGYSDLDFAKDPATPKSVSGWVVFF